MGQLCKISLIIDDGNNLASHVVVIVVVVVIVNVVVGVVGVVVIVVVVVVGVVVILDVIVIVIVSNKLYSEDTKIIALQETHLESTFIKYSWTGKVAVTPSVGAKGGVITLLSGNINVRDQFDIDNECHVLLTEITSNRNLVTVIVVNLHSPCPHDGSKLTFLKKFGIVLTN